MCREEEREYDDSLKIKAMINYCLDCVTWGEAKPILDMIEKMIGMNGPPKIWKDINKVKRRFGKKIYGGVIKAKSVSIKKGVFNGPMNQVKGNKHVSVKN